MAKPRAAAREDLAAFAAGYEPRRAALDAASSALRDERDAAIRKAFADGMTTREIASVLDDISHQRVAQIVQQR